MTDRRELGDVAMTGPAAELPLSEEDLELVDRLLWLIDQDPTGSEGWSGS